MPVEELGPEPQEPSLRHSQRQRRAGFPKHRGFPDMFTFTPVLSSLSPDFLTVSSTKARPAEKSRADPPLLAKVVSLLFAASPPTPHVDRNNHQSSHTHRDAGVFAINASFSARW